MTENEGTSESAAIAEPEEPEEPWYKMLGYGLLIWGLTVGFYFYISAFEAGDMTTARIWWPVALVYNLAGKWPVIAIGGVLGLVGVGMGALGFKNQRAT